MIDARRRRASRPTSRSSSARSHGKRLVYLDSASSSQKPQAVLDAMDQLLPRRPTPTCTAACTRSPRRRPRAYEGARAKVAAVHRRGATERDRLHARTSPRRSTSSRTRGAAPTSHEGDVVVLSADGAPRQRRAVAYARRRARHRAALDPADAPTTASTSPTSTACSTAPSCSPSPRCRTCSARSTTSARSPTPRTPPARWCLVDAAPGRAAPRRRRAGDWDADFVGVHRRTRCSARRGIGGALGARRAARRDAAVPRRRRDDPRRHASTGSRPTTCPWKFEAGTPPIAEAIGLGAAVDYLEALGMRRGPRPRDGRSPGTRSTRSTTASATGSRSTARATSTAGAARSRSLFEGIHAHDISPGPRRGRRVRPGRPPLREAADARARRAGDGPGVVLRLQRRGRRRRARRVAGAAPRSSSRSEPHEAGEDRRMPGLEDLYREIILDHYRAPRNRGELPVPPGAQGRGVQPAVRRRGRPVPRRRWTGRSST